MKSACVTALCSLMAMCLFLATPARAVPSFARSAGYTCQSCHFRPAELNVTGQDYMQRGFREAPPECPEDATQPFAAKRTLGLPLQISWANYLSIIGHHDFIAESHNRPQFDAGGIDLWIGGALDPHWSAIVNPAFDIENGGADVGLGYAQYVTRWADSFGTFRFGQTLPYAILYNQGGPTLFLSTPLVLSVPADTGNTWTPTSLLRGIELGGAGISRWNAYFGAATPSLDQSQTSLPDFQNNIDLTASGQWFTGYLDSSITAYGYWGHAWLSPTTTSAPFHRAGAFFNIYGPETKATVGYLAGSDRAADGRSLDNGGGFVMVEQLFGLRWSSFLRYDWFEQDLDAGGDRDISGPALGGSYWASTEVWITAEIQYLNTSDLGKDQRFVTELTWAF